jgi:hypothetical protein
MNFTNHHKRMYSEIKENTYNEIIWKISVNRIDLYQVYLSISINLGSQIGDQLRFNIIKAFQEKIR